MVSSRGGNGAFSLKTMNAQGPIRFATWVFAIVACCLYALGFFMKNRQRAVDAKQKHEYTYLLQAYAICAWEDLCFVTREWSSRARAAILTKLSALNRQRMHRNMGQNDDDDDDRATPMLQHEDGTDEENRMTGACCDSDSDDVQATANKPAAVTREHNESTTFLDKVGTDEEHGRPQQETEETGQEHHQQPHQEETEKQTFDGSNEEDNKVKGT